MRVERWRARAKPTWEGEVPSRTETAGSGGSKPDIGFESGLGLGMESERGHFL